MSRSGFTLIEFICYLGLMVGVMLLLSGWVTTIIHNYTNSMGSMRTQLNMLAAYAVFMRDIHSAPADRASWRSVSKDALIWHNSDKDIGWYIKNDTLYRAEGIYDSNKNQWLQKKSYKVLSSWLGHFSVRYQQMDHGTVIASVVFNRHDDCDEFYTVRPRGSTYAV